MKKQEDPEIVQVAEAIERELCALEDAARSAENIRLHNERSLEKAGKALQQALKQQEALAAGLQALTQAMGRMANRQQVAINRLAERAREIQAQTERLSDHMNRFAQLGAKATEATRILQALPPPYGTGEPHDPPRSGPPEELTQVDMLLAVVSAEAKALAHSADEADLADIAKEAGSLRQRVDSARTQLALLQQARPPTTH
jgi:flagellar biosynthesis/type III secretory pathway chaperone